MLAVETRDLHKRYGAVTALDKLTLSVTGGAVGLLGPNGAGKSTLIRILLGLIPPSGGSATVFGLDVGRFPLHVRQQVGYMPENECFIPGLDAVTYAYLAGRLVGMPHVDAMQRTHIVLNYVGLGEERYRPVGTYSTGMKQKVKFAQALVHHPKLLLLDEPTAGLDPRSREEMLDLIRDISHAQGIHVVLSTHVLPEVEAVCDEVVILDRGTLVKQAPIAELRQEAPAYEVRVKGDDAAFIAALAAHSCRAEKQEDGSIRVEYANGTPGTDPILRAAVEARVQLRHLSKCRAGLQQIFEAAVRKSRNDGHH